MSTAVVASGNYELFIDTGFKLDGFRLDDPVKGILAGYTTTTTRTNLVTNPNFEVNTTGWGAAAGATLTRTSAQSVVGSYSCSTTRTSTTGNLSIQFSPTISITENTTYTFSCYFRRDYATTRTTQLRMFYYNSVGTIIGSTTTSFTPPAQNTWGRFSTTSTAPTGAVVIFCDVVAMSAIVGETTFADGFLLETGSSLLPYFDGTYADPYTGYTLTAQQWNGTANASSSTATWGLDSSYINSDYVLDGTTDFAPMMQYSKNISINRGRKDIGDQFSAGTMTFTLDDTLAGGILNPLYTSSPFIDPESQFTLAPLRRVSMGRYDSTNTYIELFSGQIVNYDYSYELGGNDTVTVYCADDFYLLAQTVMAEFNVTEQLSSARLSAVLDLPEVAYPALTRNINTGTQTLGGAAAYIVDNGTNVKAYIDQIQAAEQGRVFMSRDGIINFDPRLGNTLNASVADFNDDGTEIPYNNLNIAYNADQIVNRASVQHLGATSPEVADDLASQAKYLIQTISITDSLLHNDTAAADLATYLLVGEPSPTFTGVQTDYLMLTTAQREALALVDIGDTISITNTIAGGPVAQNLSVEGIEHRLDFVTGHRVTYYTAGTVVVYHLVLDDALYGTLDDDNALG
jgi:hypothetical protein